jgi:ABC-type multidrug transport system fused ATPase/permease subunit
MKWPPIAIGSGGMREIFAIVKTLLPYLRRYRTTLIIALLASCGFVIAELLKPWPIKIVLDYVLSLGGEHHKSRLPFVLPAMFRGEHGRMPLLLLACGSLVVISILGGLCGYARIILLATVGQKVMARLRQDLHDHLLGLSLDYHDQSSSGDLLVRLTGDVAAMKELLVEGLVEVVQQGILIVALIAVMAFLSPSLTVITVLLLPALAFVLSHFSLEIRKAAQRQRKKEGQIAAAVGESLTSIAVIQAYTLEPVASERFGRSNRKSTKAGLAATRLETKMSRMTEVVVAISSAVIIGLGARAVTTGQMSAGDLIVFVSYVRSLYKPLRQVVARGAKLAKASACGERILEVLRSKPAIASAPGARPAPRFAGEITLDHVFFAYGEGTPVLHDLNVRLAPGTVTALVGENGAGKSSLASLIPRLRDPTAGRVLIDGQDIRELELTSLRSQIGLVFQKALLFDGTIEENILLGRPNANSREVLDAAERAGVLEFIHRLDHGLNTRVGEGGDKLSGGQRQRVALARALLRDPPILILDEPAAALDPRAESVVTRHLLYELKGKTVLLITHRLETLEHVDEILVLEKGKIVERGGLHALKKQPGPFAEFLKHRQGATTLLVEDGRP